MPGSVQRFIESWWEVAAILAAGLVIGLVLERIVLVQLRAFLRRTRLRTPGRLIEAVRGASTELVVLAAAYLALPLARVTAGTAHAIRDVLFVLVALVLTNLAARLAGAAVRQYMEKSDGTLPTGSIFVNVTKGVVWVVGFLIVMHRFGISITPILTALGVGGLAVALALQDTLSSLFSGLQILAARQIKPGDFIELESGQMGEVIDITWRNTIIRTQPSNEVIIPNSRMASSIVTNYQLPEAEMSVLVGCSVAYGSNLERVEEIVLDVARSTVEEVAGEFEEWEPRVRFHTFGDSGIELSVVLRTREFLDQHPLRSEFIKRLKRRFDEEGIEIPFPQRVVHSPTGLER